MVDTVYASLTKCATVWALSMIKTLDNTENDLFNTILSQFFPNLFEKSILCNFVKSKIIQPLTLKCLYYFVKQIFAIIICIICHLYPDNNFWQHFCGILVHSSWSYAPILLFPLVSLRPPLITNPSINSQWDLYQGTANTTPGCS